MKLIITIFFTFFLLNANINIAVSIPPQAFIAKELNSNLNVITIIKPGSSPHTYEPKPSQMIALSKANIYFAIGVEFENAWLDKFKNQNRNLKIYFVDKNITKIPITQGHEAGELDPHIWLSPKNLKIIATNMANALIENDKNNSATYKENLKKLLEKLDNLDKNISSKLSKLKNRNFLTLHPSWGYFAKDYNLTQHSIEVEGKKPNPKEIVKITKLAKKIEAKVIFVQPEFSDKQASLIANELNINIVKISPLKENVILNLNNFSDKLIGK